MEGQDARSERSGPNREAPKGAMDGPEGLSGTWSLQDAGDPAILGGGWVGQGRFAPGTERSDRTQRPRTSFRQRRR